MRDLVEELGLVHREVRQRGSDGVAVGLRRRYDAAVTDVWRAITDPERLGRWYVVVTGELRPGGVLRVAVEEIGAVRECEPPRALDVTWGGPASVVRVRLSADGEGTSLELEHTVFQTGDAALLLGPGWDVQLLGLAGYLAGDEVADPRAWEVSPAVQQAAATAIEHWALAAGDAATSEEIAAMVPLARRQFAPGVAVEGGRPGG
ncbi:SRPBCC domain-containing protein [Modestobacter roseus]|uniref:SRPBCC domain-containing protein n=1 Tax=Modestobacter roseus TaxID=1181884 RepID=UPI0034DEFDF2